MEEHFVASGRQVIPLVGVRNVETGDILEVAHAPLMCVPLDVMQHDKRPPGTCGDPGICRYGFTSRSCGRYGLTLTCPARTFDPGAALFVPARLGKTAITSARI